MRFNERRVGAVLVIIGAVSLLLSWVQGRDPLLSETSASSGKIATERTACRVLTVYDGDTLGCDLNGNGRIEQPTEEIRLLGIDSPEMRYSRKNPTHDAENPTDEPFAAEASRWMETHTLKKTVYLEFDQRRSDRYNRTLAFVYTTPDATQSLNEQLLAQGYATVLFLGCNRKYEERFQQVEAEARKAGRGLWGQP